MDLAETSIFPDGAFGTKSSLDGDLGNKMNSRGDVRTGHESSRKE